MRILNVRSGYAAARHSDLISTSTSRSLKSQNNRLKAILVCIFAMPSYAVIGASRGIGLEYVRQLVSQRFIPRHDQMQAAVSSTDFSDRQPNPTPLCSRLYATLPSLLTFKL